MRSDLTDGRDRPASDARKGKGKTPRPPRRTPQLPDVAAMIRTCGYCLQDEDKADGACAARRDGRHRFHTYDCWAALVVQATFDLRGEHSALQFFSESCWGREDYYTARRLTPQEVAAVRSGSARLVIAVESSKVSAAPSGGRLKEKRGGEAG